MKQKIKTFYETKYKWLMLIPTLLVVLALIQIGMQYAQTGDVVHRGISLKGGSTITFDYSSSIDVARVEQSLQSQFPENEMSVRTLRSAGAIEGVIVESSVQSSEQINVILAALEGETGLDSSTFSVEIIGSALSEGFFAETGAALLIAFLLMGIVVFVYFRTPIPSLAVILAAFSDIVVTLAIFNLTDIKLSTAGVAAFLMLIGFSVDTDMLLTARVLKRKEGSVHDRIYSAMGTGLTMICTTLGVLFVSILFVTSDTIKQIMIILFIGLVVDMLMTWIQNVAILRWYLERRQEKK